MPQEFHVLQCHSCQTFQVQQVKKAKKCQWQCKMCGEKQSILRVYGQGTGADCRRHVQKLNSLRGQIHEEENHHRVLTAKYVETDTTFAKNYKIDEGEVCLIQQGDTGNCGVSISSKWKNYLEDPAESIPDTDHDTGDSLYTTDRRQFDNTRKSKKKQHCELASEKPQSSKGLIKSNSGSSSNHILSGKRPLDHCLISQPAKRTKGHSYLTPQEYEQRNEEEDLNSSLDQECRKLCDTTDFHPHHGNIGDYHQNALVYKIPQNDSLTHPTQNDNNVSMETSGMSSSNFDILDFDEFLDEKIKGTKSNNRIIKPAPNQVPKKSSKWDFYISVSDEENSPTFQQSSD